MAWNPFRRPASVDSESALDAELRDHLDRQIADNLRDGMTPAEARRRAHLSIGGVAQVKERVRDEWRPRIISDLARDLRFGARLIRRSPLFAALVLVTLAFAVGANVTVFTIVNAIWLEPRPVKDPERVVVVTSVVLADEETPNDMINPRILDELRDMPVFEDVAHQTVGAGPMGDVRPRLRLPDTGRELEPQAVTANYFDVLGVTVRGRTFRATDDEAGAAAVAIISDELWRSAFGGSEDFIGSTVPTAPVPVTVVGIAPPGFRGARLGELADVWIPREVGPHLSAFGPLIDTSPEMVLRMTPGIALARLQPGVTATEAEAALNADRTRYRVWPVADVIGLPGHVTTLLGSGNIALAVSAMAALVLVAGCATLAVLMLVHQERRRRELAVRMALGCGRSRLVRTVLAEVALLAVAGTVTALLVASWLLAALRTHTLPSGLSLERLDLSFDWKIVLFGLVVGAASMAGAALIPLIRVRRSHVAVELSGAASTSSAASLRLRRGLLALHVAATLVVLVGAALLVRTLAYGFSQGAGFEAERTLFLRVQPSIVEFYDPVTNPDGEASDDMKRAAFDRLVDSIRSTPGVRRLAVGPPPVGVEGLDVAGPRVLTFETSDGEVEVPAGFWIVDRDYVDALGLSLQAGAIPEATGTILSASLARRLFAEGNILGQYISIGGRGHHVVGVVNDFVQGSMASDAVGGLLSVSTSLDQQMPPGSVGSVRLAIATHGDATPLVPVIERLTRQIFPRAAMLRVATGRQLLEADLGRQRLGAAFFTGFGLVSLLLGVAAVFGLVAYLAESRARELGVRLALGATPNRLAATVIGPSLVPVVAGTVVGLIAAALASGAVASLIHGISTLDVVSYAGAAGLMLASGLVAGLVAAVRVRRLSPMDALRSE